MNYGTAKHFYLPFSLNKLLNYTVTWWKAEKSESELRQMLVTREKPYLGVITSGKIIISEHNCF